MEGETEKTGSIQNDPETKEAIQKWDEFVTPLREFYGVERYRPKPKKESDVR